MKGAMTVPSVAIISDPKSKRIITIGASHNFFRTIMNSINSTIIDNFDISVNLLFF